MAEKKDDFSEKDSAKDRKVERDVSSPEAAHKALLDDSLGRVGEQSSLSASGDKRSEADKLAEMGRDMAIPDIWKQQDLNPKSMHKSNELLDVLSYAASFGQPEPNKHGQKNAQKNAQKGTHGESPEQKQGQAKPEIPGAEPKELPGEKAELKDASDKARTAGLKVGLTTEQKQRIGDLIWQNESGGKIEGLTDWTNKDEPFPSLGAGHMTWLKDGQQNQFGDSFSPFVKKMEEQKNPHLPSWLDSKTGNPWKDQKEWAEQFDSPKMKELRNFLANTLPEQTDHYISRLEESKPKIIEASPDKQKQVISDRFDRLLQTPEGKFALIDYVNFKGEGLKDPASGSGWGLRHVLQNMKDTVNPVDDFAQAAKDTLAERIKNRPQDKRYEEGWNSRIERYKYDLFSPKKDNKAPVKAENNAENDQKTPGKDGANPGQQDQKKSEKPLESEQAKKDEKKSEKSLEPEQKQQKKEQEAGRFALAESVEAKSHPKRGEGYYQPLKASMNELLGRDVSGAEMSALLSAAKGMRESENKPMYELKQSESVLPASAEEARSFVNNIGNSKYGKQFLQDSSIKNLKTEISSKFSSLGSEKQDGKPTVKPDAKPETEVDTSKFEIPESAKSLSHPRKGQGYFQPLKASMNNLLDRDMSAAEMNALISASRGMREAADKPVNELKTSDSVLPENANEAKSFVENIGNAKFGKQSLDDAGVAKLKSEMSAKFNFEQKAKPAPENKPAQKPEQKPEPENKPEENKPASENKPEQKPEPQEQKPEGQKPEGQKPEGQKPDAQKPAPELPANPEEVDERACACASCCGEKGDSPLKPGSLSHNIDILKGAAGYGGLSLTRNEKTVVSNKVKAMDGVEKDMPVAYVPGMKPGTMGVLTHKGIDGVDKQVPFIAGSMSGKVRSKDIVLNHAAAEQLGIKDPLKAHTEKNGEASRTEPAKESRMKAPADALNMNSEQEKQWLENSAKAAAKINMQGYRAKLDCGRGGIEALRHMGYQIPQGESPGAATDNRNVWTGARVAETLAEQPGFTRVPVKDIPGGMKALPDGTFVGRYHSESGLQARNFTMDRRFGEDPGDVDIKTKSHTPGSDGGYYRDSFAVLPNGIADQLVGSQKAAELRVEQKQAHDKRVAEGDKGPAPTPVAPRIGALSLGVKSESKNNESIKKELAEKVNEIASRPDVLKEAEERQKNAKFPDDHAYIPKPDDKFGYRRTERTEKELSQVRAGLEKDAERYAGLAGEFAKGSDKIPEKIEKVKKETEAKIEELSKKHEDLQLISEVLKNGSPSTQLDKKVLENLPADLARDLRLARFNRYAYDQNARAINDFQYNPNGVNTAKLQSNMRQAVNYYKTQEHRALERAKTYLQTTTEQMVNQQRILSDASRPQEDARQLLQHRFQSQSVAAAMLAANPDLVGSKSANGALAGKRIVVNSGHDPLHGSKYTGFPAYNWSKTAENPLGMREYDFNRQTSAIFGAMVEYAGGVPIYINQDELYKQGNKAAQGMTGLAEVIGNVQADVVISHHMDDDPSDPRARTLTLVGKDSHRLGALINDGKRVIGVEKANDIREQKTGIQNFLSGNNVVLDEMFTTYGNDRQRAMNPYEVGKMQLGLLVGVERFLNPPSASHIAKEKQKDKKSGNWESYWNKTENKPKHSFQSLRYPDVWK